MPDHLTRLSKFMSLVLRHRSRDFGLTPDAEGFVPLEAVVALVERNPRLEAGRAEVVAVVEGGQPRRFELRGDLMRAAYGHSKKVSQVRYVPVEPPPTLFHGTHPRAMERIRAEGLRAMGRQYVHLSATLERARDVGRRRAGTPVILIIRALAAHAAGVTFYSPETQHFLARVIPTEFIIIPDIK